MSLSLYDVTVPALLRGIDNLQAQIDKGLAFAHERGLADDQLLRGKLAPDMFDFIRQVQIVSDTAKFCVARLSQVQAPSWADDETGFDELKARLAKASDYLRSAKREDIDGKDGIEVRFKAGPRELVFTGTGYATKFVLPNFYFHCATAYAILRNNGVPVGKTDFLGQIQ